MGDRLNTLNLKSSTLQTRPLVTGPVSKNGTGYGRVTRVILGKESCSSTEEWEKLGCSQALYGVYYRELKIAVDGQMVEDNIERFAYSGTTNYRHIPLETEIVQLASNLAIDTTAVETDNKLLEKIYWTSIVPSWNHPNLNNYPASGHENQSINRFFEESTTVNPLQLCPGDITLEGRCGNSLRFGGTYYDGSPVSKKVDNGNPYIILRNGQGTDNKGEADKAVYEDINLDSGSIYLTSGHQVPLKQAAQKYDAWNRGQGPVLASDYTGSQIVQSSDRIFLNGRDDIELAATHEIGLTADEVNVDGSSRASLDAKKIYLGKKAQGEKEPCLKGQTATELLSIILDEINGFLSTVASSSPDPGSFIGTLKSSAALTQEFLKTSQSKLKNLHSTKIFVE